MKTFWPLALRSSPFYLVHPLRGEVGEEYFLRLSEGQHPMTGEQLVRHQAAREYVNRHGEKVSPMEHRAGWDATFSAPKSVSLIALVGGDERVREAHRESVSIALDELERYTQARIGGNLPAERLCRNEPQQPGANRRPCAHPRRQRAGRRKTRQSTLGIRRGIAWPLAHV